MRNARFYIILVVMLCLLIATASTILILPKTNVLTQSARVGLVNEDLGYTNELSTYEYGESFVTEYVNNSLNDVTITSRIDSIERLDAGEYDLVIIIPQTFSSDIMTYDSTNPTTSNVEYYVNPNSTKLDYLSNVLEKDNIEREINDMISKSFVTEVMAEVYNLKAANNQVFEMHVEYAGDYDQNVAKPFDDSFKEIINILSSVETQQSAVEVQGQAVSLYSNSVTSSYEGVSNLDERLTDFYGSLAEYKVYLDESHISTNELNNNLNIFQSTYNLDDEGNEIIGESSNFSSITELLVNTTNDIKVSRREAQIKSNVLDDVEALIFTVSLEEIKIELTKDEEGSEEEINDVMIYNQFLNDLIGLFELTSANFTSNELYVKNIELLGNECSQYATLPLPIEDEEIVVPITYEVCSKIGYTPTGKTVDNEETIEVLIELMFNKSMSDTDTMLDSLGCSSDVPCAFDTILFPYTTFGSSINEDLRYNYYDTINVLQNVVSSTSSLEDYINSLEETIDDYETYQETLVNLKESIDSSNAENIEVSNYVVDNLTEFYKNYGGYGDVTVSLTEGQQRILETLDNLIEQTINHIDSTQEISDSGSKLLQTSTEARRIIEGNQNKVNDSKNRYEEMLVINEEYVNGFDSKFTGAKNGAVYNETFFNNFITPTVLSDSGSVFNFGSVMPFLIMILVTVFAIIVSYIYSQWTPKVKSETEHAQVSKYAVNLKQLLFVTLTGIVSSLIIAYIGINALTLTSSMALQFTLATMFIGLSLTLLFYTLVMRFKIYGLMIIGVMLILFFVTNGVIDINIGNTVAKMVANANPITYFEVVLRDIIYGSTISVAVLTGIIFIITTSSIALIMTSNDLVKRLENETVY